MRVAVALFVFLVLLGCPILRPTSAALVLENVSIPFRFIPAHFGPAINSMGICGAVHVVADPLDGCTPLRNSLESNETDKANFVVIARDECYYIDKVRHAQNAGFAAAILYNDQPDGDLLTSWWDWCCQWRSCSRVNVDSRTVEASPRVDPVTVQAFPRLETTTVLARPCFTLWSGHQSNSILGETCAICLENYREGEFINALPRKHEFHSRCMASWLTKGGTLCPMCILFPFCQIFC